MKILTRAFPGLVALVLANAASAASPSANYDEPTGQVVLRNGPLELSVATRPGLNPRSLRDLASGRVYADADYVWPNGAFPELVKAPTISTAADGSRSLVFLGRLGTLTVEQTFTAPASEPGVITEQITLRNLTEKRLERLAFKCGFAKRLRQGDQWSGEANALRFCPIPYRRETDGRLLEFPLRDALEHGPASRQPAPWGAEGWVWSDGSNSLLIAKYNPNAMEWSLLEPAPGAAGTALRFGGAGPWKHDSPAGASQLEPGASFRFGETRLQAITGDWRQAYYAYRRYTEGKGCRPRPGYNPPVHWNELYDNAYYFKAAPLCFNPDFRALNPKLLSELYSLDHMKGEAAKAKALGCEALYLDPGWDTGPSHHLWDAARLGTLDSFLKLMRDDYGLKVSLWIGLAGVPPTYADPEACPVEARVVNASGQRIPVHCVASPAFLATKEKRLLELGRHGVAFLMFDSTQFTGPCYDPTHGHRVPSSREEHAKALLDLTQRVKRQCPDLLIEMHDLVSGPSSLHYTPTYLYYAQPDSFDCLWGHEFMWSSLDDLLSGKAISLYYYNLAYSMPLYLHINLKNDNDHCLAFWWYASTCRHLGVGGKPAEPLWQRHQAAMRTYLSLKRFYTQGVFYGLGETLHAHTLPEAHECVLNAFNLESRPATRQVKFRLADVGLPPGQVQVEGSPATVQGDEITLDLSLPAKGHQLVKLKLTR